MIFADKKENKKKNDLEAKPETRSPQPAQSDSWQLPSRPPAAAAAVEGGQLQPEPSCEQPQARQMVWT